MQLIDMHCDTIWAWMKGQEECCVDFEKLKMADSIAQFFACFIYMDDFQGDDRFTKAYQHALHMIHCGKERLNVVCNYEEMIAVKNQSQIPAFLTIEEGGILDGSLNRLEELYKEGIRLMTLTWNYENCIGHPNSRDANTMNMGLKSFGFEVVERMNELGMIIDVSHLSDGGFWDVLKHSKQPVVASHSNARELCNHPRNLSDKMIRALAQAGGIIGVNFYPYFLRPDGNVAADDIANHIWHIYQIGGEDVIAFGTDFDGFDEGQSEIAHIGQIDKVYRAVQKRGFSERQIEKIWNKNILRFIHLL